jgi:ribonucleoside-diphosphate reductase alpha chain
MNRDETRELEGSTTWVQTGCGKLYITINHDKDGKVVETFYNLGRSGGCALGFLETIGRLVSLLLQREVRDEKEIIKQMKGIKCPRVIFDKKYGKIESCIDAIFLVLSERLGLEINKKIDGQILEYQCEKCGSESLTWEGKCYTCMDCSFSRC